uniref:Putative serine/threonine-protein kinase At1g18390 n=1 Tax=Anthurium amnicola TaxID=1678845 RepID=A0A1D1ZKD9_9ARAE
MASGDGALFLCVLSFLITVSHPAPSCPMTSVHDCQKTIGEHKTEEWCGGHFFRCKESRMEIQFGGTELWFKVVAVIEANVLQVEDPHLSPHFRESDCDFLYQFSSQSTGAPLFDPRNNNLPNPPLQISSSLCPTSSYCSLFSKASNLYRGSSPAGTPYDVYYASEEQCLGYTTTASAGSRLPAPDNPLVIWQLRMNQDVDGSVSFTIISVGFSRRHNLLPVCFTGRVHCDSNCTSNKGCGRTLNVAGKRHHAKTAKPIIGVLATAAGLSILAGFLVYLWRRKKTTKTPHTPSTMPSETVSSDFPAEDPEAASNYPTQVFKYEELHEATNGFSPSNVLDQGGHGTVYKAKLRDGRTAAVKRFHTNSWQRAQLFMNEVAILSYLRHPNLVALYGCTSRHDRELLLVYEFIPNGTVADHLHGHLVADGALVWPVRLHIAVQTATALAYLHAAKPQVIHRDVKTKNILLDRNFNVKVADFGLSRLFPVAASHVSTVPQGTAGYVDPEYHRCYQLTDKSDVYSFGVVLAELISSKPAVDITRARHEINLANMALNKIQSSALHELVDAKLGFETDWEVRKSIGLVAELTMRCLQWEREMRPTMESVLEVLQGIEDGRLQSGKGMEVNRKARDGMESKKNCPPVSPDSVVGKWSSRMTTPETSG